MTRSSWPDSSTTETAPAYTIAVTATDAEHRTITRELVVTIADRAPDAPVDSDATADFVILGSAAGTPVNITASASDPAAATSSTPWLTMQMDGLR